MCIFIGSVSFSPSLCPPLLFRIIPYVIIVPSQLIVNVLLIVSTTAIATTVFIGSLRFLRRRHLAQFPLFGTLCRTATAGVAVGAAGGSSVTCRCWTRSALAISSTGTAAAVATGK